MSPPQQNVQPDSQQDDFQREEDALARHRAALQQRFARPGAGAPPRRPRRARAATLAGLSGLAVALAAGLLWLDPPLHSARYATAAGARKTVTLPDGSQLVLNTRSALEVGWHLRSRRVALQEGEVLFDVAHAAWRPFLVQAGSTAIRVVGTAFDVRRERERVGVTVLRGRVQVSEGGHSVLLGAGEATWAAPGRLEPVAAVSAEQAASRLAWKDGKLVFTQTPLAEALAEIARYRRAPVTLADARLADLRISGVFDSAGTDVLLDLLPAILPVAVARAPDDTVTVRARAEP
ncbi:hypothetical protein BKK79_31070 [Cupriavidus sp. USMAA2-4]|uniref:FecR family protein n=1 Tax=Cupriavidus sp. USMAA2-4 TaxID=876364 RepID=UPI0008A6F979|nr:FecR domain-containing protein [Cupriavidus sp. USMAA2-4]AOY96084.1 hypothetical protein BKK79_31070 [Cupriavidus sp. USMAA2-4]